MLVSAKAVKVITGVSVETVRAACERAGVVIHPGRLYEQDAAVAAVASHADPARIAGHAASGLGNAQSAEISTLASARARAEEARAKKLETENARTEGLLVERAAVVAAGCDLIARVRGALLSVGQRAAPVVSGLTDHLVIADAINASVREVLGELSDHDLFNDAVLQ
jgi:phage terminase Nu1 subunit (DNA packaging protein)